MYHLWLQKSSRTALLRSKRSTNAVHTYTNRKNGMLSLRQQRVPLRLCANMLKVERGMCCIILYLISRAISQFVCVCVFDNLLKLSVELKTKKYIYVTGFFVWRFYENAVSVIVAILLFLRSSAFVTS